jgi:hypothetical protein
MMNAPIEVGFKSSMSTKAPRTQEQILFSAFQTTNFSEYVAGQGTAYNDFMFSLGFKEMEVDCGKVMTSWGPQLKIGAAWTYIARIKTDIGTCTFYQLKHQTQIVILRTASTNKGRRSVYALK